MPVVPCRPVIHPHLVSLLAVAVLAWIPVAHAGPIDRLAKDVVPTRQEVELDIDPEKTGYEGRVLIDLAVRQATREIRFHARALTIDRVTLRGPAGDVAVERIEPLPDVEQVRLHLGSSLEPGSYRLEIVFHNAYNTRAAALYRVVTGGNSYLFTQFEDTEAREAFPCWDEPEFKIPWKMTLTVPNQMEAVSNTPVTRETRTDTGKRVEFLETKPLPSYLIAIAAGPFETVPITNLSVPGKIVTVKGASAMAAEAARVTPPILEALERYFGRPYPYEKLDLIAAPEFLYGAMENAGAVVFAERRLLIDPRSADPDQMKRMISVNAHELAHMWFGDLVTMKWWDDLWLNESFANWMGAKIVDEVFPESDARLSERLSIERAFETDSRPSTRAMRAKVKTLSLAETANELTYNKGQAVLSMFEGWLGEENFRKGVLDYMDRHEWKNAEGQDLWNALGRTTGEDVPAAMATFLDQPGVPLVTVEPRPDGTVKVSQRRFLTVGDRNDATLWQIPVVLRFPKGSSLATQRVWLTARETTVDLGTGSAPAWILPNAGGGGYYRWSVPSAMLDNMVGAKSELSETERIDLIGNLTSLLRAGDLQGDRYLEMMSRLADDPAPGVVRAAVGSLAEIGPALTGPKTDAEAAWAAYLRRTLQPALDRIGVKPKDGEPLSAGLARPALLRLLALQGRDPAILELAASLSRDYRNDPASVPPSLVDLAIVVGALNGDRAQFDDYRRRFESTGIPIERTLYLAGLAAFRDPALRREALDYALEGPLRPQEVLAIPSAMGVDILSAESRSSGVAPDEVTAWVEQHHAGITERLPGNQTARMLSLFHGCSPDRQDRLQRFMAGPGKSMLGAEARAARLSDAMRECAALSEREGERTGKWLMSSSVKN